MFEPPLCALAQSSRRWSLRVVRNAVPAVALFLAPACGSTEASSNEEPAAADERPAAAIGGEPSSPTGSTPDAGPPASTPPPPCNDAETAELQAALDKAHLPTTDAVLGVQTVCGNRIFSSGPAKLGPDILHRIGSVTKTYVATVILQLVKEKALSLDAPASTWVDAIPGGNKILVRHLLQHTTGLYNYTADSALKSKAKSGAELTTNELLAASFARKLAFEPGSKWEYSNTNYTVLAVIAEKVTGKPIHVLVRERLLAPLKLEATFFDGPEPPVGTIATPRNYFGMDISKENNPTWAAAAGAIVASPGDVLTWLKALGTGALIDAATFEAMKAGLPTSQKGLEYGFGLMTLRASLTEGAGDGYGHSGDLFGFHNNAFYFPDIDASVVALVTSDADSPGNVANAALKILGKHKK